MKKGRIVTQCLPMALALFAIGCAGQAGSADDPATEGAVIVKKGLDYSFARPSPSGLHSQGYTFAARYFSYDSGKDISVSEYHALHAAGVDVVGNWEAGASDALSGYNTGVAHAQKAASEAAAVGMPAGRPIYFSVDFDAAESQQSAIDSYFDGVASVLGRARTGAYGGYYPIKRLFDAGKIKWGWQTYAWSGGQWDARAQLRQTQNGITAAGDSNCCDLDEAVATDFGQWGYTPANPPPANALYHFFSGDFNGDGKADVAFYYSGDSNIWLGLSTGTAIAWTLGGNVKGFGDLNDAQRHLFTGDFNGDGKTDLGFYFNGDGNIWLGLSNGKTIAWELAGNVKGFGDLNNATHHFFQGDFNGDGKADLGFYYETDGNIWFGLSDGKVLAWHAAANVNGFGDLANSTHHLFIGDFDGNGTTDVGFYYNGDGNIWFGLSDGNALTWHRSDNVKGFGNLLDGKHRFFSGDFNGDGRSDFGFYFSGDGNIWLGLSTGVGMTWSLASDTSGFGDLSAPSRDLITGDFNGDGKTDVAFYYNGDSNWWVGDATGTTLNWHLAGNTKGFGDLLDDSRRLFFGDFNGDGKTDAMFYYNGDSNWWAGLSNGADLAWHLADNTKGFGDLLR